MELTDTEIKKAINKLKRNSYIRKSNFEFILPRCERVLSDRYNKRGRPKNKDYDVNILERIKVKLK